MPSTVEVPNQVSLLNHCIDPGEMLKGGGPRKSMVEADTDLSRRRPAIVLGWELVRLTGKSPVRSFCRPSGNGSIFGVVEMKQTISLRITRSARPDPLATLS